MSSEKSWKQLGDYINAYVDSDDNVKVDLHATSLALRARAGYCGDHGEVVAYDRHGEYLCWCGNSIMLKTEVQRSAVFSAIASMSTDPTWRV